MSRQILKKGTNSSLVANLHCDVMSSMYKKYLVPLNSSLTELLKIGSKERSMGFNLQGETYFRTTGPACSVLIRFWPMSLVSLKKDHAMPHLKVFP